MMERTGALKLCGRSLRRVRVRERGARAQLAVEERAEAQRVGRARARDLEPDRAPAAVVRLEEEADDRPGRVEAGEGRPRHERLLAQQRAEVDPRLADAAVVCLEQRPPEHEPREDGEELRE